MMDDGRTNKQTGKLNRRGRNASSAASPGATLDGCGQCSSGQWAVGRSEIDRLSHRDSK
jgi:hypothetical protein